MTAIPYIYLKISISFYMSKSFLQCTWSNIFICQLISVHLSKLPVQIMVLTPARWTDKGLVPVCATFLFLKSNPPLSKGPPDSFEDTLRSPWYSYCRPCNCPAMSVEVTKMTAWLTPLHAFLCPFPISSAHGSQGNHNIHMPPTPKRIHCKIKAITQRKLFISYLIPFSLLPIHTSITHKSHTPGPQAHRNLSDFLTFHAVIWFFCKVNHLPRSSLGMCGPPSFLWWFE